MVRWPTALMTPSTSTALVLLALAESAFAGAATGAGAGAGFGAAAGGGAGFSSTELQANAKTAANEIPVGHDAYFAKLPIGFLLKMLRPSIVDRCPPISKIK
jgi:hypothetical protein